MNIALVFPKSTFLSAPMTWPPLGLWYLAAQLEAQGHHTDFFDMSLDDKLPKDGDYHQLWISATAPQIFEVRKIAAFTKEWQNTKIVLGGAGVWANPFKYWIELPVDVIVAGEADHPDTIQSILLNAYNINDTSLIMPEISKDLEWVKPPIRRWALNYHSYMTDRNNGERYRMSSLFTSRGCPMSCSFCESGRHGVIWDRLTRYEPLWSVEAQIKEIKDQGFTGLAYYDDVFIINKKRTHQLLELHRKYGMKFRCFLRSDILCKHGGLDYLRDMQKGGLIECFIGIESASNKIKNNIHKGTTIEQDTEVVNWCKKLKITCKTSFIIGLPGESIESMKMTREWILKNRPDIVQVDRLIPFSGVPLTKNPEQYDLKYDVIPDEEWFFRGRFDEDSHSFVSTSHLTKDEIDSFWRSLERELIDEGLSSYNH